MYKNRGNETSSIWGAQIDEDKKLSFSQELAESEEWSRDHQGANNGAMIDHGQHYNHSTQSDVGVAGAEASTPIDLELANIRGEAAPIEGDMENVNRELTVPPGGGDEGQSSQRSSTLDAIVTNTVDLGQTTELQEPFIPDAFPVDDGDIIIGIPAEPMIPWWKQKRTKCLLLLAICIVGVMAIALGVTSRRDDQQDDASNLATNGTSTAVYLEYVAPSGSPSNSLVPTVAPTTDDPSMVPSVHPSFSQLPSISPTEHPSLSQLPTSYPTVFPSFSQLPSFSPTACSIKIESNIQKLDLLRSSDPDKAKIAIHGSNMVIALRDAPDLTQSSSFYTIFYTLSKDGRTWEFVQQFVTDEVRWGLTAGDFNVALSGDGLAFIGLTGLGVFVYRHNVGSDGLWEQVHKINSEGYALASDEDLTVIVTGYLSGDMVRTTNTAYLFKRSGKEFKEIFHDEIHLGQYSEEAIVKGNTFALYSVGGFSDFILVTSRCIHIIGKMALL